MKKTQKEPLLELIKQFYHFDRYTANEIVDILGFKCISFYCNRISDIKDNGKASDILYTLDLIEPPVYMILKMPTNVLCQNVANNRIQ